MTPSTLYEEGRPAQYRYEGGDAHSQSLTQVLRNRFGLTRSEARVALLLAARWSNREIAQMLEVTEHTARRHTEKVLSRLGVHSRTVVRSVLATIDPPAVGLDGRAHDRVHAGVSDEVTRTLARDCEPSRQW